MAILLALAALAAQSAPGRRDPGSSDIVAVINDEAITRTQVEERLRAVGMDPAQTTAEDRLRVLRAIVEEKLFLQEARKLNLVVSEREIDEELAGRMEDLGGERRLEDYLRISRISRERYREKIKEVILVFKMIRAKYGEWVTGQAGGVGLAPIHPYITPAERWEYFQANHEEFQAMDEATALEIVLGFAGEAQREEKRRLAESVARRIHAGMEFFVAAQLYSDAFRANPTAESIRFEVSRTHPHPSPDVTRLLMDELAPGSISAPVELDGAWILFYVESRRSQGAMAFPEADPLIREFLNIRRWDENRRLVRDELLRTAYLVPADLFQGAEGETAPGD